MICSEYLLNECLTDKAKGTIQSETLVKVASGDSPGASGRVTGGPLFPLELPELELPH